MTDEKTEGELNAASGGSRDNAAIWRHVVPFVAWLFLMQMLGDPAGWKYAARTLLCFGLLLWLRPWRGYERLRLRDLGLAIPVGIIVFVIWVFPESGLASRFPSLQEFYLRWGMMPFGKLPEPLESLPYAPATCGWMLSIMRLLGLAFVIAIIEEFFWRGFIYRWMQERDFMKVDLGKLDIPVLLLVSVVFGLEHHRWLAGIIAGFAYAGVMLKTRNIWAACVAHVTTNLLLGIYVLATGSYAFW